MSGDYTFVEQGLDGAWIDNWPCLVVVTTIWQPCSNFGEG